MITYATDSCFPIKHLYLQLYRHISSFKKKSIAELQYNLAYILKIEPAKTVI